MTAGLKLEDNSYSQVVGTTTVSLLGRYKRKEWTGGDRLPISKPQKPRSEFVRIAVPLPDLPKRLVGHRWITRRAGGRVFRWREAIYAPAETNRFHTIVRKRTVPSPKVAKPPPALHPYDMNYVEWRSGLSTIVYDYLGYPWVPHTDTFPASGWALGLPSFIGEWDSNDDLKTLEKLRNKINGSDFNAGVFLAESAQSVRMIADAATRIRKCVDALKKGNVVRAWDALRTSRPRPASVSTRKSAGDNWIEMQYGWKPLIDDMESGAQFIAHLVVNPVIQRVRSTKKKIFTLAPTSVSWASAGMIRRRQIIAYITQVDKPLLSGLTDVASVLWEKTPWSFVADWVIPIGSFLQSAALSRAVTGTFVITDTTEFWASNPSQTGLENNIRGTTSCDFSYRAVTVKRQVVSALPVPLPSVKPIGKVATWVHAANAIALLSQRLK